METQTLTVSTNWLDTNVPTQLTNGEWSGDTIRNDTVKYYNTTTSWYPYVVYGNYTYLPKIQLKLSEIEKLRELAKENSDIKEILNKFTAYIEVVVDF